MQVWHQRVVKLLVQLRIVIWNSRKDLLRDFLLFYFCGTLAQQKHKALYHVIALLASLQARIPPKQLLQQLVALVLVAEYFPHDARLVLYQF